MRKYYSVYLVYCLEITTGDGNQYYIGAHARPSQKHLTRNDILNYSGNSLNQARVKKLITSEEYYERVRLLFVEEYNDMDTTYNREKELITIFKEKFGDKCANKSLRDCRHEVGVKQSAESNRKRSLTMTGRKLSEYTKHKQSIAHFKQVKKNSTGQIYDSLQECAAKNGLFASNLSAGIKYGWNKYRDYTFV